MSGYEKTGLPEGSLLTGSRYENLVSRIKQLTPLEQLTLSLKFEQDLNEAEIAAVLDWEVPDVRQILKNCIEDVLHRD